ncbi:hypothetical protein [Cytophaga aurantiaca]|uniref:hypothetical protein n=1 Tax=Cytophaga aurantiaca TaxID=29530 RepID=UPI00035F2CEB|nr:hypothetical protein [Cytophaga aurantiaca]
MRQLDTPYYLELQRRFKDIILYVSCHQDNFETYSIKIENLFVDTCAFFDSLCQTLITDMTVSGHSFSNSLSVKNFSDKISGTEFFNMADYKTLLEREFTMSEKEVNLNIYEDYFFGNPQFLSRPVNGFKIKPFDNWETGGGLKWWTAYTKLKHNRLSNIKEATLEQTISSLGATFIILSLRNEVDFKNGKISIELYEVFYPLYWEFKGKVGTGITMWK